MLFSILGGAGNTPLPPLVTGVINNSKLVTPDSPLQVLPHFNPTQEELPHWLRQHKDNKFFPIDRLLYHREKHTSPFKMVERDYIFLILQECHDCPYMGNMSEDRTKEMVASTAWWPK
ncbi:hypothetical protein O181_032295 [Austropuccinia psidii MF-1]|uniref:Integrase zinc-binding domain-containing protein n=1 Tax=Austropuccinia psidii MF-1 TaxID=1389203 RepID=A0A9Q3H833_9BASI|nr:hypothetical protein [Austropuccinia psidii MF-1]